MPLYNWPFSICVKVLNLSQTMPETFIKLKILTLYLSKVNLVKFWVICFSLVCVRPGAKSQRESKCPELLANFCDMLLRKTTISKRLMPEEVDKKLKNVVSTLALALPFYFNSLATDRFCLVSSLGTGPFQPF